MLMKTLPCLFLLLILAACSAAYPVPTPTLAPTPAPTPTLAPTSTPIPTLDAALWKTFQDLNHHFSFAYPKAYDEHPICALHVQGGDLSSPDFIVSMDSSFLKVIASPLADAKDTDPQSAVDSLRSYLGGSYQVHFEDPVQRTVDGLPALAQRVNIDYNKDGYQESTFFKKNGMLYTVFVQTPSTCDGYPNAPTTEEAYQRILESFKIY
jgi:hypothetical protein